LVKVKKANVKRARSENRRDGQWKSLVCGGALGPGRLGLRDSWAGGREIMAEGTTTAKSKVGVFFFL
jgi:hypothetical protein